MISLFILNFRLNLEMSSQWETKFLKADYHGLILTVIRSKCPHLVGQTGILVQETKNTLKIITKDDVMKSMNTKIIFLIYQFCKIYSIV